MIDESRIRGLVDEKLSGTDKYLIGVKVRQGNRILVHIDGDQGVNIKDCMELSRFIESRLDRDKEDFELEVSSAGLDQPLRFWRQYPKNIGHIVEVRLLDGSRFEGKLTGAEKELVTIETETPVGKKRKEAPVPLVLPFSSIKETRVKIRFK